MYPRARRTRPPPHSTTSAAIADALMFRDRKLSPAPGAHAALLPADHPELSCRKAFPTYAHQQWPIVAFPVQSFTRLAPLLDRVHELYLDALTALESGAWGSTGQQQYRIKG